MPVVRRGAPVSLADYSALAQECFRRQQRLLAPAEYRQVFQKAKRSADDSFMVLARANGNLPARLGLAIAKKQVKHAVDRNRIKRIIRESFRHSSARLFGYDFVVLARRDTAQHNNDKLFTSLEKHWQKLCDSNKSKPDQ